MTASREGERERRVTREHEEYFGDVGNVLCLGYGFGFIGIYNYQNKTRRTKRKKKL